MDHPRSIMRPPCPIYGKMALVRHLVMTKPIKKIKSQPVFTVSSKATINGASLGWSPVTETRFFDKYKGLRKVNDQSLEKKRSKRGTEWIRITKLGLQLQVARPLGTVLIHLHQIRNWTISWSVSNIFNLHLLLFDPSVTPLVYDYHLAICNDNIYQTAALNFFA